MLKEGQQQSLKFQDLPKKLQQKYRNSIVFQKENKAVAKKFQFDADKLRKRKIDKEKTLEEKMDQFKIDKTEEKYLYKVFEKLAKNGDSFGKDQIAEVLRKMQMDMSKGEIELMIWEFDEDLDKRISRKQFISMYKKCMMDKAAAEPKKLFHLAQYLMYCQDGRYKITVQDSLELLYVRAQNEASNQIQAKYLFEEEIKIIFGQYYETQEDGVQKEITFKEYLEKINRKSIEKRKKEIEKIKTQLKYI